MGSPVVSSRTPVGQIINRDGTATFAFLKWMQNIGTTVNLTFDSEGQFQGDIGDQATIDGRETLASIVENISTDGVVQGPGIDFALPYLNKDTDHIADGTGSPLEGGKEAYVALIASAPIAGQTIRFNGSDWLPVAIAVTKGSAAHQWLRSYDEATGTFTASQPAFSDVSGVATKAQLPSAIAYEDEANTFTANQAITGNLAGNDQWGSHVSRERHLRRRSPCCNREYQCGELPRSQFNGLSRCWNWSIYWNRMGNIHQSGRCPAVRHSQHLHNKPDDLRKSQPQREFTSKCRNWICSYLSGSSVSHDCFWFCHFGRWYGNCDICEAIRSNRVCLPDNDFKRSPWSDYRTNRMGSQCDPHGFLLGG